MVAKTTENPQREELKQKFVDRLQLECSVSPDEASDKQIYQAMLRGGTKPGSHRLLAGEGPLLLTAAFSSEERLAERG